MGGGGGGDGSGGRGRRVGGRLCADELGVWNGVGGVGSGEDTKGRAELEEGEDWRE